MLDANEGFAAESREVRTLPEATSAPMPALMGPAGTVHILACGSVDDGKSTLIGRLLWDAGDLPEDTRATVLSNLKPDGRPDFSLLVDGLAAEREQGITIDIAWRYFDTQTGRRLVIIDSPGHEQYTRNMASGASHADAALVLVDARTGVKVQTRRHAAILQLVGVERIVLAVNKMDLVDWSEERFRAIEADFQRMIAPLGYSQAFAVPVSARHGDNVARRSSVLRWYSGQTILDHLHAVPRRGTVLGGAFRMPVQTIIRDEDFRGLAGTINSGEVRAGDTVRDAASDRHAKVRRIVTMDGDLPLARAGQAVVLQLDRDIDIGRGAVVTALEAPTREASQIGARLVWLADSPLDQHRNLLLRTATDLVPVTQLSVESRLDLDMLEESDTGICGSNDVVRVRIALARAVALDCFAANRETGSFILLDAESGNTLAGGVVTGIGPGQSATGAAALRLTSEMLASGVCEGLPRDSLEFRRRAQAAADLLATAGVAVELQLAD
jgi:bifunctional enzyme CysN/CysC